MSSYSLSSRARRDLREIWLFSAETWGRKKADNYLEEIRSVIEIVAGDYRAGLQFDPNDLSVRRMLVKSHAVFYRVTNDKVLILRVLHQAMDVGGHLN